MCVKAVWTPPETVPKSLENIHNKVNTHTATSGNYFGLQTRINLMFKQSDKITIWKLLGLLFSYLIDCNVILVSYCTSKPTNQQQQKNIQVYIDIYLD